MNPVYHIKFIGEQELSNFMEFKIRYGLRHQTVITTRGSHTETEYDYFIRLADLELLILMLSCRIEKCVNVDNWNDNSI